MDSFSEKAVIKKMNLSASFSFIKLNMITIGSYLIEKNILAAFTGLLCVGIGAGAVMNWNINSWSSQPFFEIMPIPYVFAINFLFIGLSLLLLASTYRTWSLPIGGLISVFAGLTLLIYFMGVNLPFDELFLESQWALRSS